MRAARLTLFAVMVLGFVAHLGAQGVEAEPKGMQTDVVRLQYAAASDVVPVVQQSLPNSVQRRVRIIADQRTNAVVISAEQSDLKDVKNLVATLDIQVVPEKSAPPPKKTVAYEIVLFALSSTADVAAKLPRTSSGVIDTSDPAAVLAKLREAIAQPGVSEVAKLSVMADDGRPWKWRQSVSVPTAQPGGAFAGYQEAVVELSVSSMAARGGTRQLGISGRIERFAEVGKTNDRDLLPPAKSTSTIEFSSSVEDGKLVMSAVESSASKFDSSYVMFVRVKT